MNNSFASLVVPEAFDRSRWREGREVAERRRRRAARHGVPADDLRAGRRQVRREALPGVLCVAENVVGTDVSGNCAGLCLFKLFSIIWLI